MKIKHGLFIFLTLFSLSAALNLVVLASTTFTDGMKLSVERGSRYVSDAADEQTALLDLNTATQEELETLTGIGAVKASAIIAYRDAIGGFRTVEELLDVDGITEAILELIWDDITIS